jgi:uncharacterized protein with FMN-binding domain
VRRTAFTVVATVVGLVLLLQFKTHSATSTGSLAALGPEAPSPTRAQHSQSASPQVRHTPQVRRTTIPSIPSSPSRQSSQPSRPITSTGQTITTAYGPVQVRIVETAGRLTDVTAIQLPSDNPHSREIAAAAVPILRTEALRANGAHIDVVSGATYTSNGYAQSLQSALDNA